MDAAQLEQRRSFLGASEVAAVCGLDPWKTALDIWGVKKGLIASQGNDATEMGHLIEPVMLGWYARRRGVELEQPGTLRGSEPWIAATPDSLTREPQRRNVQVKAVGRHTAHHWDNGAPEYVQVQTQWEMMVAGVEVTDVVALICSTEPVIIEVRRDERAIAALLDICREWWQRHIVAGELPELDDSETARAILQALHPERGGMLEAVPEFIEMVMEHERLTADAERIKGERDHLRNLIRQCIGSNQGIEWPGGRVTWKTNKAGERPLRIYVRQQP